MEPTMVKIEGLNKHQRALCDIIWSIDTQEELLSWVRTLNKDKALEVYVLMQLMMLAYIDDEDLGEMTEANEVIDQIRGQL
jgi:hypothetical protein